MRVRHGLLIVGVIQNFAAAGLLFGWASIASDMLQAPESEGGGALTPARAKNIFVVSSSVNFLAPLILGLILDRFGPRVCSATSLGLVFLGLITFALSEAYLMMGMVLISLGGPGVQTSIIHISNLFPTRKATATAVISGSFSLSFAVFLCFDLIWQRTRWAYSQIFVGYSLVVFTCLVLTLLMMPDQPYTLKEEVLLEIKEDPKLVSKFAGKTEKELLGDHMLRLPSVYQKHRKSLVRHPSINSGLNRHAEESERLQLTEEEFVDSARPRLKDGTLMQQLASLQFFSMTAVLVVGSFFANLYIGVVGIALKDEGYLTETEIQLALRAFTAITTAGVLFIPVVGFLMDHVGFHVTSLITITMGISFTVLTSLSARFRSFPLLMWSYVCYSIFRSFLFTNFFSHMGDCLGFKFFGLLSGISFAVAGVVGLLQYPLSTWGAGTCHLGEEQGCSRGHWQQINQLQFACILLLYVLPIMDYRSHVKASQHSPRMPKVTAATHMPLKQCERHTVVLVYDNHEL
ncbi:unnamed protein product [Chrysoparadoxa australica]